MVGFFVAISPTFVTFGVHQEQAILPFPNYRPCRVDKPTMENFEADETEKDKSRFRRRKRRLEKCYHCGEKIAKPTLIHFELIFAN